MVKFNYFLNLINKNNLLTINLFDNQINFNKNPGCLFCKHLKSCKLTIIRNTNNGAIFYSNGKTFCLRLEPNKYYIANYTQSTLDPFSQDITTGYLEDNKYATYIGVYDSDPTGSNQGLSIKEVLMINEKKEICKCFYFYDNEDIYDCNDLHRFMITSDGTIIEKSEYLDKTKLCIWDYQNKYDDSNNLTEYYWKNNNEIINVNVCITNDDSELKEMFVIFCIKKINKYSDDIDEKIKMIEYINVIQYDIFEDMISILFNDNKIIVYNYQTKNEVLSKKFDKEYFCYLSKYICE